MPFKVRFQGKTRYEGFRHKTRVDCFVTFEEREPYYPLAKEYFLKKQAGYQGYEVLMSEPWLAEQPHVVGEALIHQHYFSAKGLSLLEPSSRLVDESPPDRAPDVINEDVRIWITRTELPLRQQDAIGEA
jgi:hypothetical protein